MLDMKDIEINCEFKCIHSLFSLTRLFKFCTQYKILNIDICIDRRNSSSKISGLIQIKSLNVQNINEHVDRLHLTKTPLVNLLTTVMIKVLFEKSSD